MTPDLRIEVNMLNQQFRVAEVALVGLLQEAVFRDLARRAIAVESMAKRIATGPPPSAPGQGPGVRTGRLRASITHRLGADGAGPYADVGTAVHYAPYLEFGTRRMAARPFLRPAIAAAGEGATTGTYSI